MEEEDFIDCPVCGIFLPAPEIAAHVESHFNSTNESANALPAEESMAACTICGAMITFDELSSHEEAHR